MTTYVLDRLYATVKEAIADAVVKAELVEADQLPAFVLEVPKDKAHGDLATNAAMQLTKLAKKIRVSLQKRLLSIWILKRRLFKVLRSLDQALLISGWTIAIYMK